MSATEIGPTRIVPCLLCGHPAIAIFSMPGGCVVHPREEVQALCPQHIVRATPLGGMGLLVDLRADTSVAVPELGLPASPLP
jgi:hypothetical protein